MFVSILQLMGFPLGKPVHSRASSIQRGEHATVRIDGTGLEASALLASDRGGSDSDSTVRAHSARRQKVKAKQAKVKAVAKAARTSKINEGVKTVKAAKVLAKVKPAVKALVKPKLKPKPKPEPKAKAKVVEKAKPKVKSSGKALPKTSGKPSVKQTSSVKVPAKTAVKSKSRKLDAKAVPQAGKAIRPAAKAKVIKDSVNTTTSKKVAMPQAMAPKIKDMPAPVSVKAASAPPPTSSPSVPVRAGRPSSRLAQLTVPSMAQSVASTAAKSSFAQTMSSPVLAPPLAATIKKDPKLANHWKSKSVEQISDAELIAMPDDEYMNEYQMAFFRRRLVQLKKDILSNAGETTEHLREDTVVVPDPADRATIEEEHALELRTRDRERKLLKKIEQSIARIDAGDYGYCDETGEPIGVGRLLARPTANLSLEAQQRRELKQKMFGD